MHYTDGTLPTGTNKTWAVAETKKYFDKKFVPAFQEMLQKSRDITLDELRKTFQETGVILAPLDGLHRIEVLHDMVQKDPNNVGELDSKMNMMLSFTVIKDRRNSESLIVCLYVLV